MPTYEYSCLKCGKNFDAFQSMRDDAFKVCPKEHCQLPEWGEGAVKRLLGTGAGLIFKGSGFYITDYRSESYKEGAKKETPAAASSEKSPAAGKESTGASATPSAPAPAKPAAESKPKTTSGE